MTEDIGPIEVIALFAYKGIEPVVNKVKPYLDAMISFVRHPIETSLDAYLSRVDEEAYSRLDIIELTDLSIQEGPFLGYMD